MSDYKIVASDVQTDDGTKFFLVPNTLTGFRFTETVCSLDDQGLTHLLLRGEQCSERPVCPHCGCRMYRQGSTPRTLQHLTIGHVSMQVTYEHLRFSCPQCKFTKMLEEPFKAARHRITTELETHIVSLLEMGDMTLKRIAELTGVNRSIVREIDKRRLENKYTEEVEEVQPDGTVAVRRRPKKPANYAKFLAVDEFKLHTGHWYASHVIDLSTGAVLFIAEGKGSDVIERFTEHVGAEWMSHVEAVSMDMNAAFHKVFKEKYPHIAVVYDHFHVIKNFNEMVVEPIRKDLVKELQAKGDYEGARNIKYLRYFLMSNWETLAKKDAEAQKGKVLRKGSELFGTKDCVRKYRNFTELRSQLLKDNEQLFMVELTKECLRKAYGSKTPEEMKEAIEAAIWVCRIQGNEHFDRFANLLERHKDGIVAFAKYHISSGRIEGINNKIKTVRRMSYGLPDDEYFFLKIMDISRKNGRQERSPKNDVSTDL